MAKPNGKQPTPNPRFETSPVRCGRCKHSFEGLVFEVIDDLVQLRCGSVLISRAEMVCLNCSSVFYWNVREKDLEEMATHYRRILSIARPPHAPE